MGNIKDNSKSNLGYLGIDFQYRLINAFFMEQNFFSDLNSIIDQNMFTDTYLRGIVTIIKDYYHKYSSVPSYDMLTIKVNEKLLNDDDRQYYIETIDRLKHTPIDGYKEIEDMAERFFKQQNLIKVANKLKTIASDGDLSKYDECQKLLEDTMSIGRKSNDETHPFDNIEGDLSQEDVTTIPTGIDKLDEVLGGGLDKGKLGLIICAMGAGKALPNDEIVITPNGPVRIDCLKVGDYVIGSNGEPIMVTGVFPQGKRDIYNVTFSDGVSCRCDKEHLWTVNTWKQRHRRIWDRDSKKRVHSIDNSFNTTKTLGELEELGFRMPNHNNEHQFRIPICKPVQYISKDVKINPYLLGYMIGDGCFSRAEITVGEEDENDLIKNLKKCNFKFKVHHHSDRATSIVFDKEFKDALSGYYSDKMLSHNKFIPVDYLYNDINVRVELLNGLMDSDGYCDKKGRCSFATKSKLLAENIREIVLSLGGFASIREKKVRYFNKKYNETRECGISYNVSLSLCDNNIQIFKLLRKQNRVRYRIMKQTERYFEKCEFVCNMNATCIKVDAEDELFLTKDYIVTHNTSMTTCIAANAAAYKCDKNNNEGYKVLQLIFEDKKRDLRRKYIAKATQIESKDLSKSEEGADYAKELLMNFPDREIINNNVLIKKLDTGEVKASDVREIIKKKINEGFKPDLVIIDYFECIEGEYGSTKSDVTEREGKTMRKFENMAEELDVAIWIPTQGNRDSISAELVTNDKVGGSIRKNQIAQVVLSITRSVDDIKNKRATIAVLKNRSGGAGNVLNGILFDNGTCTITTDNVIDFDSALAYNEYAKEKDEELKQNIKNEAKKLYKNK